MGTEQGPTSINLLDIWISLLLLPFLNSYMLVGLWIGCIFSLKNLLEEEKGLSLLFFLKNGIVYLIFLGTFTS